MSTAQHISRSLPRPHEADVEIVERKGIGHPDSLADGIAELASIRYAQYCQREFGAVLHHNLDKVAVLGGRVAFGEADGEYNRPVRVVFGGRASTTFAGRPVPVPDILSGAAHEQLRAALPAYDRTRVEFRHETTDSSKFPHWFAPRDLDDLPERHKAVSNDTAYLVGCAPYSATESATLAAETFMHAQPWAGSDIKVMAVRRGREWEFTLCVPALAGTVKTAAEFHGALTDAADQLRFLLEELLAGPVRIQCNAKDSAPKPPLSGQYFTVSGSAVDYGEDGMVGRGNARNGLISPLHAPGTEALFGKNPAYHVGKVGGWLLDQAAAELNARFGPSRVAAVWRIGSAYSEPAVLSITADAPRAEAEDIVGTVLSRTDWLPDLVDGERYRPRVGTPPARSVLQGSAP
ncbi:methionine adenosyltransferase [Streptomyces sp. NPDC001404]|uniref:methionine adenosyltransferase n=1 Tax=Streptomyces sp. NPDC001404 TaxID=3364571 RepID=UPI0036A3637D